MAKDNQNKTRCTKIYRYTSQEVAEMAGCSESLVKKVRAGSVKVHSHMTQKIQLLDDVLQDANNKLIKEVENLIRIK